LLGWVVDHPPPTPGSPAFPPPRSSPWPRTQDPNSRPRARGRPQEAAEYIPIVGGLFGGIPYYYVIKMVFIIYLINPAYSGAQHIANLLVPIFSKWTAGLDSFDEKFEAILQSDAIQAGVNKIDDMDTAELEAALLKGMDAAGNTLSQAYAMGSDKAMKIMQEQGAEAMIKYMADQKKRK